MHCAVYARFLLHSFLIHQTRSRKPYKNLYKAKSPISTDMTKKKRKKKRQKNLDKVPLNSFSWSPQIFGWVQIAQKKN